MITNFSSITFRQRTGSILLAGELISRAIASKLYPPRVSSTEYQTLVSHTIPFTLAAGVLIIIGSMYRVHAPVTHRIISIIGHFLGFTFTINLVIAIIISAMRDGTPWIIVPAFLVISITHFARAIALGKSV